MNRIIIAVIFISGAAACLVQLQKNMVEYQNAQTSYQATQTVYSWPDSRSLHVDSY
jgi:hypothetical protein